MTNYYEILGINRNATAQHIRITFKKLAVKYHPDKNPGNKAAEEKFKQINEAYQVLSHADKKYSFDQKLEYYIHQSQPKPKPNPTPTHPKTEYKPYTPPVPDFKAGDYSKQGKHYSSPDYNIRHRSTSSYILGFSIFFIIAAVSLLLGMVMNNVAAKEHYNNAVNKYQAESYSKAMKEVNEALHFDEKFEEAYELRGDIRIKYENYTMAFQDYTKAIEFSENPSHELLQKRDLCQEVILRKKAQEEF